jgi:hypothetical protein
LRYNPNPPFDSPNNGRSCAAATARQSIRQQGKRIALARQESISGFNRRIGYYQSNVRAVREGAAPECRFT